MKIFSTNVNNDLTPINFDIWRLLFCLCCWSLCRVVYFKRLTHEPYIHLNKSSTNNTHTGFLPFKHVSYSGKQLFTHGPLPQSPCYPSKQSYGQSRNPGFQGREGGGYERNSSIRVFKGGENVETRKTRSKNDNSKWQESVITRTGHGGFELCERPS